jgi:hypothetical protein
VFIQQDKICPINQITQYYLKDTVELPFKHCWAEFLHERISYPATKGASNIVKQEASGGTRFIARLSYSETTTYTQLRTISE